MDLDAVAEIAGRYADDGERLEALLPTEPSPSRRTYLCAYLGPSGRRWLALDADGAPVTERNRVRESVSIAALCEIAEETAGGGELEELRQRLAALRVTEAPAGIEEAEAAALELERTIGAVPRVASPTWLDEVGAATRRLERALGSDADSPFAVALHQATAVVEELARDVEAGYKLPFD